ncbi:ATP-binding protein [Halomontanus rarus]|uniref:ATP-binding protein n=1 Tax=Halomontanus rarus TaxID=3034020 RepID=UPI001A991763
MAPAGEIERWLRLADQAGHAGDERVHQLLAVAAATENDRLQRRVQTLLGVLAVQQAAYPFRYERSYPDPENNVLDLGVTKTGSQYTLPVDVLPKHLLVAGQSGAGKTTLFYTLMQELSVPWWAFDLKRDYRHLTQSGDTSVLVVPWQRLRLNPLSPPPGVPRARWAQVVAEVFGHAHGLLSASKNYFMAAVMELYDSDTTGDPDTESSSPNADTPQPTFHDLNAALDAQTVQPYSTESQYRSRVRNRLDGMLRVAGPVFDCQHGYPIIDLLEQNVVFEFDGLRTDLQDFLMELLFAYVYEHRLANATTERNAGLQHVFFLDEGKRVFSVYKERSDAAGIPHIADVAAKMREFGEGLIVADQEPSKLTDSIKANTYTKILLPTGDQTQFQAMAEAMQLSRRQREYAHRLEIGEGLVQVGHHSAVPVRFPDTTVAKTVTDANLVARFEQEWKRLPAGPQSSTADSSLFLETEAVESGAVTAAAATVPPEPAERELSPDAQWLLEDIVEQPFRAVTDRYAELDSRYKGDRAQQELLNAGFVTSTTVHLGKGRIKLFELTAAGRAYLQKHDIDVQRTGRGGIEHRFWQHRIKQAVEAAGGSAWRERADADVYATFDDRTIAIEVAMGNNQREIDHVEKHLDGEFDAVIVACRNQAVRKRLQERAADADIDRSSVAFRLVREFLGDEPPGL